jgi:small subunit ribosomal protein S16
MAVKIRMRRTGANRDISYRVVATDSRAPRNGKCLETLGWYDPKQKGTSFHLNVERLDYWRSQGAQVSPTVLSLLKKVRPAATPTV